MTARFTLIRQFKDGFAMYLRFAGAYLLSNAQYKGWPLMVLRAAIVVVTDPIATFFLFSRFGSIGVWSVERVMLVYALAVTSFGMAEGCFNGYASFPWHMIRSGNFDRLLLRPRSLFVQVAGSNLQIHRFARVGGGLCCIIWSLSRLNIQVNAVRILLLLLALAGGMLSYAGVLVLTSGIGFFTVQALDWIYIFTYGSYNIMRCPVNYLPKALRYAFTFFMPLIVISYYPAAAICGWDEAYWKGFLAFPAGLAFLLLAFCVWRIGVRHYTGTGS